MRRSSRPFAFPATPLGRANPLAARTHSNAGWTEMNRFYRFCDGAGSPLRGKSHADQPVGVALDEFAVALEALLDPVDLLARQVGALGAALGTGVGARQLGEVGHADLLGHDSEPLVELVVGDQEIGDQPSLGADAAQILVL